MNRDRSSEWTQPSLKELGLDLVQVRPWERGIALAGPLAWIALFFGAGSLGWWPLMITAAMAHSFFTYGSVSHDLVHRTLGLTRFWNEILLSVIEASGFRSGHAYRFTHLHHHRMFPDTEDVEARTSRMGWVRALADGVVTQPRLWIWAFRRAPRPLRTWILVEGVVVLLLAGGCLAALPWTPLPAAYLGLMVAGSWIFPLVTVVVPHRADGGTALEQTRLFRGRILSWIAFGHLYHLEHHLYPAVPHQRWGELARRLDPHFRSAGLKPLVLWR